MIERPKLTTPYSGLIQPLRKEEFEALERSIKLDGYRESKPIEVTEDFEVLDGHNRLIIKPDAPIFIIPGSRDWPVAERKAFVFRSNNERRNLSPDQRKENDDKMRDLAKELRRLDEKKYTQEVLAKTFGVSQPTVSDWFRTNIGSDNGSKSSCQVRPDARVKVKADHRPVIFDRYEAGETQEGIAADYGVTQRAISKILEREHERRTQEEETARLAAEAEASGTMVDVRCCSMQELLADIRDVDAIITDPPYPEKYLPLYEEMASLAKSCLRETHVVAAMCGQSYLPDIFSRMSKHLEYRWTMAYLTIKGGQKCYLTERCINSMWKPILVFGSSRKDMTDVVESDGNDKRFHHWGQSVSGMVALIEKLTEPGQLVCDPFFGAGTTGVACVLTGRRFVGCDINQKHVDKAKQRILAASTQPIPGVEDVIEGEA